MLSIFKQGTIWVHKKLGTFHVICYNTDSKVYATGNVSRPKSYFEKNFVPIKQWNMIRPVKLG
jgi:hypothetical protein